MSETPVHFSVTLKEERQFAPNDHFAKNANFTKAELEALSEQAKAQPEAYWAGAAEELSWFRKWDEILKWEPPRAEWFVGGKLNASYNCLDRHLSVHPHKAALVWEGEPNEVKVWTYAELHGQVRKLTAALRHLGLHPGDRVAIYLPMIPEALVAILACARGGFVHTVVFGGFSSESLKDRMNDAEAKLMITADGSYRKGAWIPLKEQADRAVAQCPSIRAQIVVKRVEAGRIGTEPAVHKSQVNGKSFQEFDWGELLGGFSFLDCEQRGFPEEVNSEHPLFILYTSGTTGKPKGIVHATGGYLTGVLRTTKMVFDLKPQDLYWCTADIGWITGHSYVVYGPLAAGASIFIYEGAPTHPQPDRFWRMIEQHRISILYTAPTAIRAFMRLGAEHPQAHDLGSLRLLGTVGEPINPEAWMWYFKNIGRSQCPVVDTYWQTETGAIVISPVPGATVAKPGSATYPLPGYDVEIVDRGGHPVPPGSGGYLVIRKPWPSMARTIHGDPERFRKQYWSEFPGGIYFTGDGARKDEDGNIWCLGRVDDVLNVSGHRLGTMEIESALVSHPKVAEAAVVGRPDELKGQAVVAFVTLKSEVANSNSKSPENSPKTLHEALVEDLKAHVTREIGAIARPDDIRFADGLPKTRSGKIMRRLLRELATNGRVQGDTTTLEDLNTIAALQKNEEE